MAELVDGKAAQVGPFKQPRKLKTRSRQETNGGVLRSRYGDTYKLPCALGDRTEHRRHALRARVMEGVARVTAVVRFNDKTKAERTRRIQ